MDVSPEKSVADQAMQTLRRHGASLEAYFKEFLRGQQDAPARLIEAMEYSLLAGGKRLRPTLVLECYRCCAQQDAPSKGALAAAAAVEMIHTFSLVHDDLPAMDDDDLRRGRPTNHKVFGEAMAILAGDAMLSLAFEVIALQANPAIASALIAELARATGPQGMIGGQVLDIVNENKPLPIEALQQIHRMKTGALLTTSCRLGAIAAKAPQEELEALTKFGDHLGLAFQIVDDILDVTSTSQQLGKATHKDAGKGKNTYPSLLGLDASRAQAQQQLDAALDALSSFGKSADELIALARYVVARQS